MKSITIGSNVWVPARRIGLEGEAVSALVQRQAVAQHKRTVTIQVDPTNQVKIGTKLVHSSAGIAIFLIGDFTASEETLLDPLAKSVLQFSRLLLTDNWVRLFEVRSLAELALFWGKHHAEYRHVVLVGHGSGDAILFGSELVRGKELSEKLFLKVTEQKVVISLCCKTGRAAFAKDFSNRVCRGALGARTVGSFPAPKARPNLA